MEDGISLAENTACKMGATNNNVPRIVVLQERKKQIEETLAKRTLELRQICIQEAELTGLTPPEMPLEPGEQLPSIRRRVGTSYQLPEDVVKNISNKDENIADLELQFHWHANMAEAALGLANENNLSRTMKRQHRNEYQKHKNQCLILQEKLALLKEKAVTEQQHKQKKKQPRVPDLVDDNVSLNKNITEPFLKSDVRHSIRSMKHAIPSPNDSSVELRYSQEPSRHHYRNSDITYLGYPIRTEDMLATGIYKLSLNGYHKYLERRENPNVYPYIQQANLNLYNIGHNTQLQHNLQYQPVNQHMPQYSPHMSQHSPLLVQQNHYSPQYSQGSQQSPQSTRHSPAHNHMPQQNVRVLQHNVQYQSSQQSFNYPQYTNDYNKYSLGSSPSGHFSTTQLHRQSSPTSLSAKTQYYSHTIHGHSYHRQYQNEFVYRNPHQIQPHQQYEQAMGTGLGGCWKQNEHGELVWCNNSSIDASWQSDKRFGSLDRRKNKRVSKRISPNIDSKSATLVTVSHHQDQVRCASAKPQIVNRRSQDNGQLVRTQSLGSVGAHTIDSVYPSDDNSSCGSEHRGYRLSQTLRKKEKEWVETSLDGPISPTQSILSSSQPTASSIIPPEEKFVRNNSPQRIPPPLTPKPALEIPAESNPSPRVPETNIELFNNNIVPKNCTIVQAGHCKPYHEETKPFEMSDFYKYSTKFKKSPVKSESDTNKGNQSSGNANVARHLEKSFEENVKMRYSPLQFYSGSTSNAGSVGVPENNMNASFELEQVAVSENFSAEMNAWYKDQQKQNNNTGESTKIRSATLV